LTAIKLTGKTTKILCAIYPGGAGDPGIYHFAIDGAPVGGPAAKARTVTRLMDSKAYLH